jgi:DNA-binding response OmpR family regulator
MKKILIIEDDEALLQTLSTALDLENFKMLAATYGEQGLRLAGEEEPDILVVDWVLPSLSGLEICQKLRTRGVAVPIIILSGKKKEEVDRILGLELGADDYLVKPFGTKELIARIRAVLRRSKPEVKGKEKYSFGFIFHRFIRELSYHAKHCCFLFRYHAILTKY